MLLHVAGRSYGAQRRHRLAELSTELIEMTGFEPVIDVIHNRHVVASIDAFAGSCRTSMLIAGGDRTTGTHGLGAVSEQLVRTAPCSVLIAPAGR